jgi:putative restriction endonuclease
MNAEAVFSLLGEPAWDSPFFKKLPLNDTGDAVSHQSGVVIPKDLRDFFPALDEAVTSHSRPTVDRYLTAEMFVASEYVGSARLRYQYQTWGNTRRPESRITDNLGPIRNRAHEDDVLLFQRCLDRLDSYRLILIPSSDHGFGGIHDLVGRRRWGSLFVDRVPILQKDLSLARSEMLETVSRPFASHAGDTIRIATTRNAIARDIVFRETLLSEYGRKCAVSGIALAANESAEVEAAHVIPLSRGGPDEPRNGLPLTGTLHWAFDQGLFGISEKRRIVIPPGVRRVPCNSWLMQFDDQPLAEASSATLRTAKEALEWHRLNCVSRWS